MMSIPKIQNTRYLKIFDLESLAKSQMIGSVLARYYQKLRGKSARHRNVDTSQTFPWKCSLDSLAWSIENSRHDGIHCTDIRYNEASLSKIKQREPLGRRILAAALFVRTCKQWNYPFPVRIYPDDSQPVADLPPGKHVRLTRADLRSKDRYFPPRSSMFLPPHRINRCPATHQSFSFARTIVYLFKNKQIFCILWRIRKNLELHVCSWNLTEC